MKDRLSILPMKALAALALVLGLSPVTLTAGCCFLPDAPIQWIVPLLFTWVWGSAMFLLPGRGRAAFAACGAAALALGGLLWYRAAGLGMILILAPCVFALFMLPPSYARLVWEEWTPGMWIAGGLLHLIAQIVASRPPFDGLMPYLRCAFLPYVFLLLLCFNRTGLRSGMHGAAKAPAALRARNTLLTVAVFLIALAASLWERMAVWADAAWRAILRAIGAVIDAFMSLMPETGVSGGGGGGGMDMSGLAEGGETSPLAEFLEKVMIVAAILLGAAVLVLAVRALAKKLVRLVRKIRERLRAYGMHAAEDYVDEAESTLNWEEKTKSLREKIGKSFSRAARPAPWEQLTGPQRVRRLYQQYLKKRPEMKNKTAREALTEGGALKKPQAFAFASLYEKARYSDHDISASEADELRKTVQDTVKF